MRRHRKMLGTIIAFLLITAIAGVCVVTYGLRGPARVELEVYGGSMQGGEAEGRLTVLSLNAAHGRRTAFSQVFVPVEEIEGNLDAIAGVLAAHRPDLVALQEIDGPSGWSGRFNHVHYLADKAGFPQAVQGEHVAGLTLSYGTAVLSRLPVAEARSYTFAPSPPTPSKGYVLATVSLPGSELKLDVVSVHLDFMSAGSRRSQAQEMIKVLGGRGNPLILMGDLNCEWADEESAVSLLVEKLGLKAYRPEAEDLATFGMGERRLDWVLISGGLEFEQYEVLDDSVSDHRGVLAVVRVEGGQASPSPSN